MDDMINNLKNMMGEKDMSDVLSQISPEMIESFSKMMGDKNSTKESTNNSNNTSNNASSSFDFSGLDMDAIFKLQSVFKKMNNNKDDPRANLLSSLKPYLRDERKENIDKYIGMLKFANLTELTQFFNNDKKENN